MKEFLNVLESAKLFEGIDPDDLASMAVCLGAKFIKIKKGDFIITAGGKVEHVGIVLEGRFQIIREDINGGRALLALLDPGEVFAEALCCAGILESPVSVLADADSQAMLIQFGRILHTCPNSCEFHIKLIGNMLGILASKNLKLQNRMELLSKKSIRARLMGYLEAEAINHGRSFSIPLNREELADFLCIDRSAMSRELGRMKEDGLIDYWKNNFKLL